MTKRLLVLLILMSGVFGMAIAQYDSVKIHLKASHESDYGVILRGDAAGKEFFLGKEDLIVEFFSEDFGLWKGGRLFIHSQATHGATPSDTWVEDLQIFSNAEAGDHAGLYQLWYEQSFKHFSLLAGQIDLNSEFVVTEPADVFTNSSFGTYPSITANISVPIFPLPALGAIGRYTTQRFTYRLGVFDGNPGNFESNPYGITWSMDGQQGILAIAEADYTLSVSSPEMGRAKFGVYYHSASFNDVSDSTIKHHGNPGVYTSLWKLICKPRGEFSEGLTAFLQAGAMPEDRNAVGYYLGLGLRSRGLMPRQYNDVVGFGLAHAQLSRNFSRYNQLTRAETVIEMNYRFCLGNHYFIQPILQCIFTPGGNPDAQNTLVGFIRFSISL